MHPRSKDRSGNRKLLDDIAKQQGLPKPGEGGGELRKSKMGQRLAALRAKKRD